MAESNRVPFLLRIRKDVKSAAELAAIDSSRSLSSYIEQCVIKDLTTSGYMKPRKGRHNVSD
jgi:predicted HicB family RNase H-like nuclease